MEKGKTLTQLREDIKARFAEERELELLAKIDGDLTEKLERHVMLLANGFTGQQKIHFKYLDEVLDVVFDIIDECGQNASTDEEQIADMEVRLRDEYNVEVRALQRVMKERYAVSLAQFEKEREEMMLVVQNLEKEMAVQREDMATHIRRLEETNIELTREIKHLKHGMRGEESEKDVVSVPNESEAERLRREARIRDQERIVRDRREREEKLERKRARDREQKRQKREAEREAKREAERAKQVTGL